MLKAIINYVMKSESPEKKMNSDSTEGITHSASHFFEAHFKPHSIQNPQLQATIRKPREQLTNFYRTAKRLPPHALPGSFSCDWEDWRNSQLFITESYDDLSCMDKELKSFGLKPPIRPVAYQREELCVVETSGTYYSFDFGEFELMRLNDAPNDEMALKEFNKPGRVKMELLYEYSDYDD